MSANTYRGAVQDCWAARKRVRATKRQLAEEAGLYAPHVTDYLSDDPSKRELPARHIPAFEAFCANHLITEWLAVQAGCRLVPESKESEA